MICFLELGSCVKTALMKDDYLVSYIEFPYDNQLLDKIFNYYGKLDVDQMTVVTHGLISKSAYEDSYQLYKITINDDLYYCNVNKYDIHVIKHMAELMGIPKLIIVDKLGYYEQLSKTDCILLDRTCAQCLLYVKKDRYRAVQNSSFLSLDSAVKSFADKLSITDVRNVDTIIKKDLVQDIKGLDTISEEDKPRVLAGLSTFMYANSEVSIPYRLNITKINNVTFLTDCAIMEDDSLEKNLKAAEDEHEKKIEENNKVESVDDAYNDVEDYDVFDDFDDLNAEDLDTATSVLDQILASPEEEEDVNIDYINGQPKEKEEEEQKPKNTFGSKSKKMKKLKQEKQDKKDKSAKEHHGISINPFQIIIIILILVLGASYGINTYIKRDIVALNVNKAKLLTEVQQEEEKVKNYSDFINNTTPTTYTAYANQILGCAIDGFFGEIDFTSSKEATVIVYLTNEDSYSVVGNTFSAIAKVTSAKSLGTLEVNSGTLYKFSYSLVFN